MATFVKRGNKWQAVVRKSGIKPQAKTFSTKALAEAWAGKIEFGVEQIRAGITSAPQLTVREILEKFRDEETPNRKGERWEEYRIEAFLQNDWVESRCDALYESGVLRQWRDDRLKEVGAGTVLREMSLLSSVFGHAMKEGWIKLPANPCSLVKRPPTPKSRSQIYTQEEFESVAGSMPDMEPQSAHDWMRYCAWFSWETAMREGEICQLRWCDIDVANRMVKVLDEWTPKNKKGPSVKNGQSRNVPLSTKACQMINTLSSFFEDAPETDLIFQIPKGSLCQSWMTAKKTVGLEHMVFHDIRRTALTRLAKTFQVMELAKISGHRNVNELLNTYYNPDMSEMAARMG